MSASDFKHDRKSALSLSTFVEEQMKIIATNRFGNQDVASSEVTYSNSVQHMDFSFSLMIARPMCL